MDLELAREIGAFIFLLLLYVVVRRWLVRELEKRGRGEANT